MLTSQQIRAARGLLRWSARELAERAGVHLSTVQRMERSDGTVRAEAHTESGAVFVREAVVRLTGKGEQPFRFLGWRQGRLREPAAAE